MTKPLAPFQIAAYRSSERSVKDIYGQLVALADVTIPDERIEIVEHLFSIPIRLLILSDESYCSLAPDNQRSFYVIVGCDGVCVALSISAIYSQSFKTMYHAVACALFGASKACSLTSCSACFTRDTYVVMFGDRVFHAVNDWRRSRCSNSLTDRHV